MTKRKNKKIILNFSFRNLYYIKDLNKYDNTNYLCLNGNSLEIIPKIDKMGNLEIINISTNRIRDISNCFRVLHNLRELYLQKNNISKIKNLKSLKLNIIDLSYNDIIEISELNDLINLKKFLIFANDIREINYYLI